MLPASGAASQRWVILFVKQPRRSQFSPLGQARTRALLHSQLQPAVVPGCVPWLRYFISAHDLWPGPLANYDSVAAATSMLVTVQCVPALPSALLSRLSSAQHAVGPGLRFDQMGMCSRP